MNSIATTTHSRRRLIYRGAVLMVIPLSVGATQAHLLFCNLCMSVAQYVFPAIARRHLLTVLLLMGTLQVGVVPAVAQTSVPLLGVSPHDAVSPGQEIYLTGSYYTPGGYPGLVLFDGVAVDDYYIPRHGRFSTRFVVPPSATPGEHLVEVCAGNPCFTGEFEQRAGATINVTDATLTSAVNYQAQAFEVTQGVRGDLVTRAAPFGDLVLPSEDAVHVSGRRTIVRVFPWAGGSGTVRRITAKLYGSRDGVPLPGSPIVPTNGRLRHLSSSHTLEEMRADPTLTWNFVLPASWVNAADGEPGDFSIDLVVVVNPDGVDRWPECTGCFDDNTMYLGGVDFVSMTRDVPRPIVGIPGAGRAPLLIRPILIDFDNPVNHTLEPPPTRGDLSAVLGAIHRIFPIPDGSDGMAVTPPRTVHFADTVDGANGRWYFFEEMESQVFPGGTFRHHEGEVYLFLFSQGCGGQAIVGFAQSAMCVGGLDVGPYVPIHEVGHALGRGHAGNGHSEAGGGGFDAAYPGSHGQVEANTWGYDVWRNRVIPPTTTLNEEGTTHDLMSYGPLPEWTSQYTWKGITDFLGEPAVRPAMAPLVAAAARGTNGHAVAQLAAGDYIRLGGYIGPTGQVDLHPLFESSAAQGDIQQQPSGYSLSFLDPNGSVISTVDLHALVPQDAPDFAGLHFSEVIAPPDEWQTLRLTDPDGNAIDEWTPSLNVPLVELLLPAVDASWGANGEATVSWNASDADGDALTFRIEGSPDQGQTWFALTDEIEGETSAMVPLDDIPGGGFWMVRVQASDGLNVGVSDARGINIAPKSPAPLILNPADGAELMAGEPVPLHGLATDWQDGVLDPAQFVWEVDGEEVAQGTATPTLSGLSEGPHEITLRVSNNANLSGEASLMLNVQSLGTAPPDPGSLSLADGGQQKVELMWDEVPGALTYAVQIAADEAFQQIVEDATGVVAPMFFPASLQQGVMYYWRVQALNEHGASAWSPPALLTTGAPPIIPEPDVAEATLLDVVTVEVIVGDANRPVSDLFGVGFKLHYDPTRLSARAEDVQPGTFLDDGNLITFDPIIDEAEGTIAYSLARKDGAEGVSGFGTVAVLTFTVPADGRAGVAHFSFSDVLAVSVEDEEIPLLLQASTVNIRALEVWPGDTNNDGIVKVDDLLPVGFYFGEEGPARPQAELTWTGQAAIPWDEPAATYADATGEGLVSQNDVLPMGLHFSKEHSVEPSPSVSNSEAVTETSLINSGATSLAMLELPALAAGTRVEISLAAGTEAQPMEGLLGVAAELILPPALRLVQARAGDLLDDGDLLAFTHFAEDRRTLSVAYARKGRTSPAAGRGLLFELDLEVIEEMEAEIVLAEAVLSLQTGSVVVEPDTDLPLTFLSPQATSAETSSGEVAETFALDQNHPNPFNPTTTITFSMPETQHVRLAVFDVLGRHVATLVDSPIAAGRHEIIFDATDLPGGVYVYQLRAGAFTSARRLVLMK